MRDRIFYLSCFGFVLGVLVRSFVSVDFYFILACGVVAIALLAFFLLISRKGWAIAISVCILAFSLGVLRFHVADTPAPVTFESRVGERVTLSGVVVNEPDVRTRSIKLIIETKAKEAKIKILLSVGSEEDVRYGDEIHFKGKLEKPENFITEEGKEFDYIGYLRKDGILYVMNYPKTEVISGGHGSRIKNLLFSLKEQFLQKVNFAIRFPESSLMGGLILGEKSDFDPELRKSFVDTGTIHIVALSGYNLTIVAEWFMKLFASFPEKFGIGMGILSIFLFVLMTGGSSTAIRAGIMASLALVARATGRNYDVARALVLAGVCMVLLNPFVLAYDISFQLSFIATVAVIFFAPRIEKYFLWIPKRFGLRDIAAVTTAAYSFVLPFILYKMGSLSLVALPANVLILPFIPLTMLLGFLTGLAGLFSHIFAAPFGFIAYVFLHYELGVVDFFARLPFAALAVPDFPLFITLSIYAYFVHTVFGKSIRNFFFRDTM